MSSLAHKIRIYPSPEQEIALRRACGVARLAWNWGLAEWQRQYKDGEKPSALKLKRAWNAIKSEEFPFVYESPKDANQHPFQNLDTAFSRFFKKTSGYPQPKTKKTGDDNFYVSNDKFAVHGKTLKLPKIGKLRMAEKLRFDGKIKSGTVSRKADMWFISIQVHRATKKYCKEDREKRQRQPRGPIHKAECIGVDLGVTTAVTLSTGEQLNSPKDMTNWLKRPKKTRPPPAEIAQSLFRKLQLAQRIVARKAKERLAENKRIRAERKRAGLPAPHPRELRQASKREQHARLKVAKIHARIARRRLDFLHKTTTRLCRENQVVKIEDLNVRGMLKNERLARSIADIGFYEFRRQLTYKAPLFESELVVADRWFPSSRQCRMCGVKNEKLGLKDRTFFCGSCGHTEDRDIHASRNLSAYVPAASPETKARLPNGSAPAHRRSATSRAKPKGSKREQTNGDTDVGTQCAHVRAP